MNVQIPENEAVLAFLIRSHQGKIQLPPHQSTRDPYWELGSHPDVVERVWDELGTVFGQDSRQIVCGRPALVHPMTGVVLTIAWGTRYVLRLSEEMARKARDEGFKTVHMWSDGTKTDIESDLGPGWIFGQWSTEESILLRKSYDSPHSSA
jgi:hypothetical protein